MEMNKKGHTEIEDVQKLKRPKKNKQKKGQF